MNGVRAVPSPKVLHVIVGHGLPTYFVNAVRSVRSCAPHDRLLIVDNASPDRELHEELRWIAGHDGNIDLVLRPENDVRQNRKVGSLYSAYEIAFAYAIDRGFDLLHLIQGDFQVLWWDDDVVEKSNEIFAAHTSCVNILTQCLPRTKALAHELQISEADGLMKLQGYGITDTGLFHLGRWKARSMKFGQSEQSHAQEYLSEGLEVLCHPWPTDAAIPWPAVVRNGLRKGREVTTTRPYLLRPLTSQAKSHVKAAPGPVWLEDVCIPWGWVCVTPMWTTDVNSIDYWVGRYRDARRNGFRSALPRLELSGVDWADLRRVRTYRYRPSLFRLTVVAPLRHVTRAFIAALRESRG